MPVYEYHCNKCDINFDKLQTMMEKHVSDCPKCEMSDTSRVWTVPSIKVISDADLSQRLRGVPKSRLERTHELKDDRKKRKQDPSSEQELISNELHAPPKRRRQS